MGMVVSPQVRDGGEHPTQGSSRVGPVLVRGLGVLVGVLACFRGVRVCLAGVRGCVAVVAGGVGRDGRFWTRLV